MIKGFVFNKFRGDLDILKPGFRKLKQNTGKPVFGTIPLTKFLLPEEDSITSNSKHIALNRQNLKKIDSEIAKLSKVVKSSLNIRAIEKLL
jgi:adenosylcobyric acid synthase